MYTFGYIREAIQAHLDLDETEAQALNLQSRYHIFANEAMQAICAVKPKFKYFECTIVDRFDPLIDLGDGAFRKATDDEINWQAHGSSEPNFADELDTKYWYNSQHIYLTNTSVNVDTDFISFSLNHQAYKVETPKLTHEQLIGSQWTPSVFEMLKPIGKSHFRYGQGSSLTFLEPGRYKVPYKAIWYLFKSGIGDSDTLEMPFDILMTIPLYIAAICLQIDHAQRALNKRAEFEAALARCNTGEPLPLRRISSTF